MLAFGIESGGRWALDRAAPQPARRRCKPAPTAIEHVARALLRRYGVVFWRLLGAKPDWLPPWRDLLRVYRRLEARGEIRGGRFVAGFSGEQYALPEAVGLLREMRRKPASGEWVSLSGADPLNLVGILTPGPQAGGADRQSRRLSRRHADRSAGRRQGAVPDRARGAEQWEAEKRLVRSAARGMLADLV